MSLKAKLVAQAHRSTMCVVFRSYSRQKGKSQRKEDPRKSTRYPFVPGDPIQQGAIHRLSAAQDIGRDGVEHKKRSASSQMKIEKIKSQLNIFETESGLRYEKILDGDIRLGRTILAAKTGKSNDRQDTILLEGRRLIQDALLLGAEAKSLYFTDPAVLQKLPTDYLRTVNLYKILYRDMKTWSDTATPSGLLGVFRKPHQGETYTVREQTLPITVVLDSLKDPGNTGTIIRTAAAVGCERVIALRGSVNLWEGKVLRSAMGGHFSIPLYWGLSWSDVGNYIDADSHVLLADTHAGKTLGRAFDTAVSVDDIEDSGLQEDSSDSDTDTEMTEQQMKNLDKRREHSAYAFHKVPMTVSEYSDISLHSHRQPRHDTATSRSQVQLPHMALVLGGETEGLSAQAKKFAFDHYGQYVTIPMSPAVDSLNTGVAASIVLYELRRKLLQTIRADERLP